MNRLARLLLGMSPGLRRTLRRLVPGADRLRTLLFDRPQGEPVATGERRAVVYLPTWLGWDSMRQRPQYLLAAFARAGFPVYFVDPRARDQREVEGVHIVRTLREVPRAGVIVYLHFAPIRHLIDGFDDAVVIYDVLDDLSIYDADEVGLPETRRVLAHHPHLVERADLMLVSNAVLKERHRTERPDLILVENGVDPVAFGAPVPRPDDLPEAGRPLIGYHGMMASWFDFELVEAVARARPDWQLVLVGPHDASVADALQRVSTFPNVTVIGERPSDLMPGYAQAFDVGVIWFKVDRLTQGVSPLKMYEYLAAGTPCVATPLPSCVGEPLVETASGVEGMVAAIERALGADGAGLAATASAHSWDARLAPVLRQLEAMEGDRVPPSNHAPSSHRS